MASITIRNLPEDLKYKLKVRAAFNQCSMEEEARRILQVALNQEPAPINLATLLIQRFQNKQLISDQLEIPPREPMRTLIFTDESEETEL